MPLMKGHLSRSNAGPIDREVAISAGAWIANRCRQLTSPSLSDIPDSRRYRLGVVLAGVVQREPRVQHLPERGDAAVEPVACQREAMNRLVPIEDPVDVEQRDPLQGLFPRKHGLRPEREVGAAKAPHRTADGIPREQDLPAIDLAPEADRAFGMP